MKKEKQSFVRVFALLWADILVAYALFVMQDYLTQVWDLSFTHAAGILNVWGGISMVLPVFFLFFADAFMGHFYMLLLSSFAFAVGIGFVAMSTPPVLGGATGKCKEYKSECIGHTHKVLLYAGMALIAVGTSGHLVSLNHFLDKQVGTNENGDTSADGKDISQAPRFKGKKQVDNSENGNRKADNKDISMAPAFKDATKLPGFLLVVIVPIVAAIALPYIKPWSIRFGIPAICTVVATLLFLTGWFNYKSTKPEGSPITNVCRVFVAFAFKASLPRQNAEFYRKPEMKPKELHSEEEKPEEQKPPEQKQFTPTRFLRCLEKAAIIEKGVSPEDQINRWKLCCVSEVEEAKIAVRMVPIWLTFIICGVVSSIGNTYFVEQSKNLNRRIGKWNVPVPALLLFFEFSKKLLSSRANRLLQKWETYGPPIGISVGMMFSVLCCITAAKIETRRLNVIRDHNLFDKPDEKIPMSLYWLLFQFFLLAGLDSFFGKSVNRFYQNQAPESMTGYLEYFTKGVSGLGFMCSVLTVSVVGKVSEKGGRESWFQHELNKSRLDRYYWVLAALSSVNLVIFAAVACMYRYKNCEAQERTDEDEESGLDGIGQCFSCC